jgi:cell division protease FtsH
VKSASTTQRGVRILMVTLLVLVVSFVLLIRSAYRVEAVGTEVSLDRVLRFAKTGQILWAKMLDEDAQVTGEVCEDKRVGQPPVDLSPPIPGDPKVSCPGRVGRFRASYPRSDVSTQQLIEQISDQAPVVVDKQTGKGIAKLVVTFVLPLLILANLFGIIFFARGGDDSIAEIAGFGKLGRKRQRERQAGTGVTFADVAGADESVTELREVTDYLRDPQRFEAFGAAPPKGVLLFGPPGCGKTLLARATAGESNVPFFSVSGTDFVESLVGVGAARVRDLFRQVREVAPAIVFIDEIDAVGRRRSGEGSTGGEREQTVNQLLVEMDGFEVTTGIVLMGATNRPDILDPALLRPGRFDRHVTLDPPDVHGRQAILELHTKDRPISEDVDFEALARRTPGFTGADLANVMNEAALLAIRGGDGSRIEASHLSEATMRVLHGPQRRGRIMTAEERKRIAYHESGHALVTTNLGYRSQLHRVSIVARGRGLGQSMVSGEADRVLLTRSEIEAQLVIAMGGMAAEELYFGEASTAAQDDINRATRLALQTVGMYGMSAQVGRRRVLSTSDGFLGAADDDLRLEPVSGQTLQDFDAEVKRLMETAEQKAKDVLTQHRETLERLAEQLEEEETLEGQTLESLLSAAGPEASLFGSSAGVSPSNGKRKSAAKAKPRRAPTKSRTAPPAT